jgi:hypothetical protein
MDCWLLDTVDWLIADWLPIGWLLIDYRLVDCLLCFSPMRASQACMRSGGRWLIDGTIDWYSRLIYCWLLWFSPTRASRACMRSGGRTQSPTTSRTPAGKLVKESCLIIEEESTDCFTYPKSPRRQTLYSPPFVAQNWAVLRLRCSTISALNCHGRTPAGCGRCRRSSQTASMTSRPLPLRPPPLAVKDGWMPKLPEIVSRRRKIRSFG